MTHDTHATGSPRQMGRRNPRPELGRPSLFADFDQEAAQDVAPQRIRLLSTLESQRGARGRPRSRRQPTGRTRPWLTRALMALMALGMLVMLLSFIQLLRRPVPTVQTPRAMAATVAEVRPAGLGAAASAPAMSAEPTAAAEIIDMAPPAVGMPHDATSAQAQPVPSPPAARPAVASPPEPERAERVVKQASQRPGTRREASASQDDVALVEAMLAHAGPRKAPPSPAIALQQCGTGSSPETTMCRAKVCVQHPSLPACRAP